MPTFPTHKARQRLDTGAGTVPRYSTASPVGDALRGVGGTIEGVGTAIMSKEDRLENHRTGQEYERFTLGQGEALDTEADATDGSQAGLASAAQKRYEAASNKFLSSIPKKRGLRQYYAERLHTFGDKHAIRAGNKEESKRHSYYRTSLSESLDRKKLVVMRNPDSAEALIKKRNAEIDGVDLPPAERNKMKKAGEQVLIALREITKIKSDPAHREKWLKAYGGAKSPANLRSYLVKGKANSHADGLSKDFTARFSTMMAAAPEKVRNGVRIFSGFRSNEHQARLYKNAVHKYGSSKAARKWVAPPGKSNHNHGGAADLKFASDDVKKWVHANAGKFGMNFRMGHEPWHIEVDKGAKGAPSAPMGSAADPEINRVAQTIGFKGVLALLKQAEGAEKEDSARTAAFLSVAASRNELDYTDLNAALESGDINTSKWATLTKALDKAKENAVAAEAGLNAVHNSLKNGTPFDTSEKANRDALDAYYDGPFSKATDGMAADVKATATANLVKEIGAVPGALKSGLKAALLSKNAPQRQWAADMLGRITENSPRLLEAFGGKTFRFGLDAYHRAKLGVPWPRALEMAEKNVFDVDEGTRKARRAALKADKTEETVTEEIRTKLADEGDSGLFSLDAEVPDELLSEFADLFVSEYEATGSLETATKMAEMGIRKRWAISHINGTGGTWAKDAPEAHYSVFNDPKRDGAWMREQAEGELEARLITGKAKISGDVGGAYKGKRNQDALPVRISGNLRFSPMPDSHRGKPSYQILVIDEDGAIQSVKRADGTVYEWVPHWDSSQEKKRQTQAARDKAQRDNEKLAQAIEDRKDLVKRNAGIKAVADERATFEANMKKIRGE